MKRTLKRTSIPVLVTTGTLLLAVNLVQAQTDRNNAGANQGTGIPRGVRTNNVNTPYYYTPMSVYSLFPGGYVISSGGYVVNGTYYNGAPNLGNVGSPIFSMDYQFPGIRRLNGAAVINGSSVIQYAPPVYNYFGQGTQDVPIPNTGGQTDPNNPNSNGGTDPNNPNGNNPNPNDPNASPTDPAVNGYYLNPNLPKGQAAPKPILSVMRDRLNMTSSNLMKLWSTNKIAYLTRHIDSNAKIAIYLGSKYQYSIKGSEYINLTKRALRKNPTTTFILDAPQRLGANQYLLTGRHAYRDAQGNEQAVRVAYVLEDQRGRMVITQTGAQTIAGN